jgi:hypothetical protein
MDAARTAAPRFRLQFAKARIQHVAHQYDLAGDRLMVDRIGPRVRDQGYYTRAQLVRTCRWKSARPRRHVEKNADSFVREVTRTALAAKHERVRIELPLILDGVSWPTASVLLHFAHPDRYPILDWRALEALGTEPPAGGYSFEFWWAYVQECRRLADAARVDMRMLDRALWQWSKGRLR